ncbi:MAG: D-tyrosyl-tRNA(Tyr) deacylase [Firmicutes bacterium]|nr:D-aminoacyl-tRNA deacylase [Bacillota bacterium]NLO65228.1 D-tyrosyl-tRNA(Tyr) deacylase [Bacillota bacterium]
MRAVVQRVRQAGVRVEGKSVAQIDHGLLVFLGVGQGDTEADSEYLAEKVAFLRIFPDEEGKMNLNVQQVGGSVLAVSQFTLYGDARRGRRPSFSTAASPAEADELYQEFVSSLRQKGVVVETGIFQAQMEVELLNDGPVTILLSSEGEF